MFKIKTRETLRDEWMLEGIFFYILGAMIKKALSPMREERLGGISR